MSSVAISVANLQQQQNLNKCATISKSKDYAQVFSFPRYWTVMHFQFHQANENWIAPEDDIPNLYWEIISLYYWAK